MLRQLSQIWRSCKNSVFSCRVLRAYVVTIFLFVVSFFLCCVCIVGMGARAGGGRLLCGVIIGNMKFLDFLDLSQFPKIVNLRFFRNLSGNSYVPCLLLIITLLHLWWKDCPWLSATFYFAFYVFINSSNCYSHILPGIFLKNVLNQAWAPIVINSHTFVGIYFVFLKNVLDQTWRFFKTEFGRQQKYRKESYQVSQIFGWYRVKGLMVAKFIKEVGFERAWSELGAKKCS